MANQSTANLEFIEEIKREQTQILIDAIKDRTADALLADPKALEKCAEVETKNRAEEEESDFEDEEDAGAGAHVPGFNAPGQ
jgi:hypothetical protein